MIQIKIAFPMIAVLALICQIQSHSALAHGDGEERIVIERESEAPVQAGKLNLSFDLLDLKQKKALTESDLAVVHEKKLHLFIFDPALKEFRHEHPEFIQSKWQVSVELPRNADYWVYAQGTVIDEDGYEFTASARLKVTQGAPENPTPPALIENRQGVDGVSVLTISGEKIKAGKNTMLTVNLSRNDGTSPQITPYLGALAHVVATPDDGDSLVHVHPMSTGLPNQLMLHVLFPKAGKYRVWAQFLDAGQLKTVALAIEVINP